MLLSNTLRKLYSCSLFYNTQCDLLPTVSAGVVDGVGTLSAADNEQRYTVSTQDLLRTKTGL